MHRLAGILLALAVASVLALAALIVGAWREEQALDRTRDRVRRELASLLGAVAAGEAGSTPAELGGTAARMEEAAHRVREEYREEALPALAAVLASAAPPARKEAALRLLAAVPGAEAAWHLEGVAGSPDAGLRRLALRLIARERGGDGPGRWGPFLLDEFRSRPAVEDRLALLSALGAHPAPGVVEVLTGVLGSDPDAGLRRAAARALAEAAPGHPAAVATLREALSGDPGPGVRQAAASALGLAGGPELVPFLRHCLARETDASVRGALQRAIASLGE
ncbi:MAG: HEAT repeat domain-containing protein [Planctomycetes bacterium]|nr:HEAT repeat domain-containing protein [Planctomycetota bacterium]